MPDIEEWWWERNYPSERRSREHLRLRPASHRPALCERPPARPRIRSPDACATLIDSAERLRQENPARSPLLPEPKILRHLAYHCLERSDLLHGRAAHWYSGALIALSAHWRDWVRPPDVWEPPDGDAAEQFGSLARHLFAAYEVPRFMDAAWRVGLTPEGVRQQGWYKQIGLGQNIRFAADLPVPLTKRMAHFLAQAPDNLDIPSAFRWAQVRGLGGDDRLARSVVASRIGTHFDRDEVWLTVVRWLIDHPDLAPGHHGPVIDYLYDQRFVPSLG